MSPKNSDNHIKEFIRIPNTEGLKTGIFVGKDLGNGMYAIGISLCNFVAGDEFDKDWAEHIAVERALKSWRDRKYPSWIEEQYNGFEDRCKRYFKYLKRAEQNIKFFTLEDPLERFYAYNCGCGCCED